MNRSSWQRRVALLAIPIVGVLFASAGHGAIPASERMALINLYNSTNGAAWFDNTNWNGAAGTECTWHGITCNAGQTTVLQIELGLNNLAGSLPAELQSWPNLQSFLVTNNALTGPLPALAGMTNLQEFSADFNQLTGSVPVLSGLTSLQSFSAIKNQLSGPVPVLAGLANLKLFDASENALTGSIPSLAGLANLSYYATASNQLTGPIPSLAGLSNLTYFNVANNQLTGTIPSLAGLTNLVDIAVSQNLLTGTLPSLDGLSNLESFGAGTNALTGSIPLLAGHTKLIFFIVGENQLSGSIPSLAGLSNLSIFSVNNNQLTGPLPALTGLTKLEHFFAFDNQLTGTLPALTAPIQLRSFEVGNNQFTGTIPSLNGFTSLGRFNVSNNQLTGPVPMLPATPNAGINLTFNASHNQLTGTLPPLTAATRLAAFNVSFNLITGAVPAITGLTKLTAFNVSFNQMTGDVPTVPAPNVLVAGGSALCPNALNVGANAAWDAATGQSPWSTYCTTPPTLPAVTTDPATSPVATGVTFHGLATSNGASTAVTFQYGTTTNYGSIAMATQSPLAAAAANVPVSATISGLSCNTTYHFRAVGTNFAGTTYGADSPFTTAPCGAPNALLAVAMVGTGAGTATSDLPGIACGNDCSESYANGTDVVLLVTPNAGSVFTGWSGECTGNSLCNLPMTAPRSVTATVAFLNTGSANSSLYVQKSYVAYYGRPAEPAGLAYWATRMDNEGGSLGSIINAFGNSDEFNRRYGGLSYVDLVTKIYQQALGRDPEQAGLDYYVGELQAGRTNLQAITLNVLDGATGSDAVTVANRLDVANHYTGKVAQGCPYNGEATGVASLVPVSSVATTVWPAKIAIEVRCAP